MVWRSSRTLRSDSHSERVSDVSVEDGFFLKAGQLVRRMGRAVEEYALVGMVMDSMK